MEPINPEMVALARQSRGWTQAELASRMGVGQATVSKLEAGIAPAAEDDIAGLAEALDYPTAFFTQDARIPGPGLSELFHRKRQKAGAKELNRIHSTAAIHLMNITRLSRSWEQDSEIPILPIDQFGGDPEKIARTVRALWHLPPGPVFDVTKVIEDSGGVVLRCIFLTRHVDGFSRRMDYTIAFFMNEALQPDRWRWTLAHELGHMVMHVDAPDRPDREIEHEADMFAGEFLAPAYEMKSQLWNLNLKKLAALKLYWKISMQAIVMRAYHLNTIGDSQKRYMFMQLSKGGYRVREPVELEPPKEEPSLVRRMIKFHMDNLGYSTDDLMAMLKLNEMDYKTLLEPGVPLLRLVK